MNYGPFNSSENTNKYNPINFIKKTTFNNTRNTDLNNNKTKKSDVIDDELKLKAPKLESNDKPNVELIKELNPNNYNISIENVKKNKKEDSSFYLSGYETGPGRGFGNLNISNDIRLGNDSRGESKDFKIKKESEVIDRWQYIDTRFQNVNNVVMEIPRGGETTRKKTQNNNDIISSKTFEFKY